MRMRQMEVVLTTSIASLAIATVIDGFKSAFVLLCVPTYSGAFTVLFAMGSSVVVVVNIIQLQNGAVARYVCTCGGRREDKPRIALLKIGGRAAITL